MVDWAGKHADEEGPNYRNFYPDCLAEAHLVFFPFHPTTRLQTGLPCPATYKPSRSCSLNVRTYGEHDTVKVNR